MLPVKSTGVHRKNMKKSQATTLPLLSPLIAIAQDLQAFPQGFGHRLRWLASEGEATHSQIHHVAVVVLPQPLETPEGFFVKRMSSLLEDVDHVHPGNQVEQPKKNVLKRFEPFKRCWRTHFFSHWRADRICKSSLLRGIKGLLQN